MNFLFSLSSRPVVGPPTSYTMGTWSTDDGVWTWPLSSKYCRNQVNVDLHNLRFNDVVFSYLGTETTLFYFILLETVIILIAIKNKFYIQKKEQPLNMMLLLWRGTFVFVGNELELQLDSIGFWRWCATLINTGFLDFVHRPEFYN
jgi:hypothetical protein